MDNSIRVKWSGGERTFTPGAVVRIGREPTCEVALTNTNVSRHHAELEHTATGWVLRDTGSAQGTWLGGVRSTSVPVSGSASVSLGQPPKGEVLELVVAGSDGTRLGADVPATQLPGAGGEPAGGGGGSAGGIESAGTVVVGGGGADRPGGRLRDSAIAGATVVTGESINLECAGRSYTFQPGRTATIGRDESCDVVTTNPTVSRRHAQIRYDGSTWLLEDLGSSSGTFVDGDRVTTRPLAGSVAAWLGTEDTGERLVLVTSGTHTPPRGRSKAGGRSPALVAAVGIAVVALLAAVVAVVAVRSSGPDDDELAKGTVLILTEATVDTGTSRGTIKGQGSGTIIDAEQGLVLTNAHVVQPDVEGLEPEKIEGVTVPNPDSILINITPGLDQPAEPKYRAEVVAVDGYLDLAVIKLTKTVSGRFMKRGEFNDLTQVDIGDSDEVKTGDKVNIFGFPTAAQSSSASLSTGVISGPVGSDQLETNRAYLNVDAPISPGNSGGLAANEDGELIGVPSILRAGKVGSIRPVNLAMPLIKAAQSGKDYKTPYHE